MEQDKSSAQNFAHQNVLVEAMSPEENFPSEEILTDVGSCSFHFDENPTSVESVSHDKLMELQQSDSTLQLTDPQNSELRLTSCFLSLTIFSQINRERLIWCSITLN